MTIELIQRAILNNEEEFKGIQLPTRQRGGTDSQIVTYSYTQAQNFYLKYNQFIED